MHKGIEGIQAEVSLDDIVCMNPLFFADLFRGEFVEHYQIFFIGCKLLARYKCREYNH